jgi:hypothetical protein
MNLRSDFADEPSVMSDCKFCLTGSYPDFKEGGCEAVTKRGAVRCCQN